MRGPVFATTLLIAVPALAQDKPAVVLDHAIARAAPAGTPTAAYVVIANHAAEADTLIGGSCTCAGRVELHRVTRTAAGGSMDVDPALPIPAGGTVKIAPPGVPLHLMFIDTKAALVAGKTVDVTLRFARAGEVKQRFIVVEDTDKAWKGGAAE